VNRGAIRGSLGFPSGQIPADFRATSYLCSGTGFPGSARRYTLKRNSVSSVYENFQQELDAWERQYSGSPAGEMVALCLLALEREEIVAIGYREDLITQRLQQMPLSEEIRDLIKHALLWAWKDEEMHAVYVRGALFKLGSWPLRIRAFGRQVAGAIAGWSASIRQHVRWSTAPLSRTAATVLTGLGSLAGKVPGDVKQHLAYGPFRNFCLFNVDAEKTAWLCWHRMAELAPSVPGLPPNTVSDFRRVEADEDRHRRVFQILADALDEHDRLLPTESAETLIQKIGEVSEFFLPRRLRTAATTRNALGSGGTVWAVQGNSSSEKLTRLHQLLEQSGLAGASAIVPRNCTSRLPS
jgi:hypothetical protein